MAARWEGPARLTFWGFVLLAGAWLLTGCHGEPHALEVNVFADGGDAAPGDGVCEVTPGAGDCTLRAALDEANVDVDIERVVVPAGSYTLSQPGTDDTNEGGDLDVFPASAGPLTISAEGAGARIDASGAEGVFDVRSGSVKLSRVAVTGASGAGASVASGATLAMLFGAAYDNGGAGLVAASGATLSTWASTMSGNGAGGVDDEGTTWLAWSTVTANAGGGIVGSATTKVDKSIVAEQVSGADCSGPVATENAHNLDSDSSCGLDDPSDLPGTAALLSGLAFGGGNVPFHHPLEGSPVVDSVASGCGSGLDTADQRLAARPVGGSCDRGAIEANFALDLVVDHPGALPDAVPGDGRCDVGDGTCSMRAALTETNAGTVTTGHHITLVTDVADAELHITAPVSIDGSGHTLDAQQAGGVVVAAAPSVTIEGLTITGGTRLFTGTSTDTEDLEPSWGGGLRVEEGDLVLRSSTVIDNEALSGGGLWVRTGATATVDRSAIVGNESTGPNEGCTRNGCIRLQPGGGGFASWGTLLVTNSTISGNRSTGGHCTGTPPFMVCSGTYGGGGSGSATIVASTVVDNTASTGSALDGGEVRGSILVGGCYGTSTAGYNVGPSTCAGASTDVVTADPALGELADNGGPTATHSLELASPARNLVPVGTPGLCDGSLPTDQRGVARPLDDGCDSGAVELEFWPLSLTVDDPGDIDDAVPGDRECDTGAGVCTLRAAITEANAQPLATDTVTVAPGVDPVLSLAGSGEDANATGDLDVLNGLTIEGNGQTVDGGQLDRVLHHAAGTLTVDDLTITGGRLDVDGGRGAGIYSTGGPLVVERSTITSNQLDGPNSAGGAIHVSNASAAVVDSTISFNGVAGTSGAGGGIANAGGDLVVVNSTMVGNTAWLGGAVYRSGGQVHVSLSTIASNNGLWSVVGLDVTLEGSVLDAAGAVCLGPTPSNGYNVASDATCDLAAPGDQQAVDPLLGPLADNGGATLTMLPLAGSPTHDLIPQGTADLCDGTWPSDQRGVARHQAGGCDSGAVEVTYAPSTFIVDDPTDVDDPVPGDGVCGTGPGGCTLRAAITETNTGLYLTDTVVIAPGVDPVLSTPGTGDDENASGDLDVLNSLTIEGNGQSIDGGQLDRVLDHHGGTLTVNDVSITGGLLNAVGEVGGGIRSVAGSLVVNRSTISGNGLGGPGSRGGGLFASNDGTSIEASTISTNSVVGPTGSGGGVHNAGGALSLVDSTVSGNSAEVGAALERGGGSVVLGYTTVAENVGVSSLAGTEIGTRASVFAAAGAACADPLVSSGRNAATDATCTLNWPNDQQGVDPALGPLADNGGPTDTHLPGTASAVVDVIPVGTSEVMCSTAEVDQRGIPRPQGIGCDIGAVEQSRSAPTFTVDDPADGGDVDPGDEVCDAGGGTCTLRAAIDETNAHPSLHIPTIALATSVDPVLSIPGTDEDLNATGDLDVRRQVILRGNGQTVDAAEIDRVLHAHAGPVTIEGVTITGGRLTTQGSRGAGIYVRLTNVGREFVLRNSTVTANHLPVVDARGAGIYIESVTARIEGSTISGNTTSGFSGQGGGISSEATSLEVLASTFHGNHAFVGSAIHRGGGYVDLIGSTVAGNTGGYALHGGWFRIGGTILGVNGVSTCGQPIGAVPFQSYGYNLVVDTSCQLTQATDQQGVTGAALALGPLADNGGPALTLLPAPGSLAIDAIPFPSPLAGLCDAATLADQRGVPRPQGAGCDIGAVEQ